MQPVTVYTKPMCPYCLRALDLLNKKGAEVREIMAAFDEEKRKEMLQRSNGRRTYPQIFIGKVHVGGYEELAALESQGKLEAMLHAA
jgi:glutaredoxin 3